MKHAISPRKTRMLTTLSAAFLLAGATSMPLHAQDTEVIDNELVPVEPVLNPDPAIVEAETPQLEPGTGETGDVPEVPGEVVEGPADEPPAPPALPEGVALDNDGNPYPEGGPAGLYTAIVDKQQKLGMEGTFDAEGNLEGVSYTGGNQGQQNALSRLRANLERKLKKMGLLDEMPADVPDETAPDLTEATGETGDTSEAPGDVVEAPLEDPALPEGVALDNDGNAYPEGGPAGLYTAIVDKQQKVGMEGNFDAEGNLEAVSYTGGNQGQQNALSRLRANLERKLKKMGLLDDAPSDVGDTGGTGETPALEGGETTAGQEIDVQTVTTSAVKPAKTTRIEKVTKVEKAAKPTKVERIEKPQKVTRVEKPQRPEKVTRVEKPQRPDKVARVEKPQRPQKPVKPEKPQKPDRPGRS